MGILFDIQRCSYHDGPGIRTTVFFKGCQLRCAWCHNPESFILKPQLQYIGSLCSGCQICAAVCPQKAHSFQGREHRVDFSSCRSCGKCAAACPASALKISGYEAEAASVMDIVLKDRAYYEASGGGLTVSGGEPTFQPEFLEELLSLAQKEGLHTCLETNGYIPPAVLETILPLTDLFLLDYKMHGEELYTYTLAQGGLWDHTLSRLQEEKKPVILRLPVIPGLNDSPEHFARVRTLRQAYSCIQKVEIMPYHTIGAGKWEQLGLQYSLDGIPAATPRQKSLWEAMLSSCPHENKAL